MVQGTEGCHLRPEPLCGQRLGARPGALRAGHDRSCRRLAGPHGAGRCAGQGQGRARRHSAGRQPPGRCRRADLADADFSPCRTAGGALSLLEAGRPVPAAARPAGAGDRAAPHRGKRERRGRHHLEARDRADQRRRHTRHPAVQRLAGPQLPADGDVAAVHSPDAGRGADPGGALAYAAHAAAAPARCKTTC